jgi:hypothetical protein
VTGREADPEFAVPVQVPERVCARLAVQEEPAAGVQLVYVQVPVPPVQVP